MAGQALTVIDVLPRVDQFVTIGPLAAAAAVDQVIQFPQLPRTDGISFFIDQITYSVVAKGSTGAKFRLLRVPNAASYADVAAMVTAGQAITGFATGTTPAEGTLTGSGIELGVTYGVTVLTAQNEIEPGDRIVADFDGTVTNLAGLIITIRYSTRRK